MRLLRAVLFTTLGAGGAWGSSLVTSRFETTLLPHALDFTVLLPDGYEAAQAPFPLLYLMHGGDGDNGFLRRTRPIIEEMWKAGTLPKLVAVTPDADRSFYMDYKDGSQRWETLLTGPLLDHLRKTYKIAAGRAGVVLFGISMGGLGGLRMGFKYPERFAAVAALEPGIDPAVKWADVKPRNRFWRSPELMRTIFGDPFDAAYWEANNPAAIALGNAANIKSSRLEIYFDAGDLDMFHLDEAAEFLHRLLWDQKIPHEYHLVRGADHLGRTLRPRSIEALAFLARALTPPAREPAVEAYRKRLEALEKRGIAPPP